VDAAALAAENGHEAVVKALIEAGADVNKARMTAGRRCTRPLTGHEAVVKALIEAGADVNKARDDGETPLHMAA
jgi:cytohesin